MKLLGAVLAAAALVVGGANRRAAADPARTISIFGTNDLHGALERLPIIAGYVANLRAARAADGGAVLVLDGGDLFQGTIESNLSEGGDVIRAYNAIGYDASAIGNHEFDYGPVGPAATPTAPGDDPRGALIANMRAAHFPFLVANLIETATGKMPVWPAQASILVEKAGVKIGIIGASTVSTPHTTMPANFVGLQITPAADAIVREAKALRARGAAVIVVTAHLGSKCTDVAHPEDDSSCDHGEELYKVLADVPRGTVDVVVAGHTHAGVAQKIDGVAVIESFSSARAFGRVDLHIDAAGKLATITIASPHELCTADHADHDRNPVHAADCKPGDYEGKPVVPDPAVAAITDAALARASAKRNEPLGHAVATAIIKRKYEEESALGNLFADLMLAAHPEAAAALTNGGGLRADIPAGKITYGALYEAMPFDNRYALIDVTGAELQQLITRNLKAGGGIFSWAGLHAVARCTHDVLDVAITIAGKPLVADKTYSIVTSDFLASGGDDVMRRLKLAPTAIHLTDVLVRESMADLLRARRGAAARIDPAALENAKHKRLDFVGARPLKCGPETQESK